MQTECKYIHLERRHTETLSLPIMMIFNVKLFAKTEILVNTRELKGMFAINICLVHDFHETH